MQPKVPHFSKRRLQQLAILLGVWALWLVGGALGTTSTAQVPEKAPLRWGERAPGLHLQPFHGPKRRRNSWRPTKNQKIILLVFGDIACPAYHLYLPRIVGLKEKMAELNGDILWIYPHALDSSLIPYPGAKVYKDLLGQSMGSYRIARLPTLVLLQKDREPTRNPFSWGRKIRLENWSIRYAGAVDQDPEGRAIGIRQDLVEALRDLSHSPYVRIPATRTHGCPYPVTQRP
ncbi:MAG: hypothetical protein EBR29_01760 [Sphingobacteriia bacterium]|nr:hypothetical protein [Sphingobacteriia bacterium]